MPDLGKGPEGLSQEIKRRVPQDPYPHKAKGEWVEQEQIQLQYWGR